MNKPRSCIRCAEIDAYRRATVEKNEGWMCGECASQLETALYAENMRTQGANQTVFQMFYGDTLA